MNAPDLASRLGLRRSGHDWRGRCPACDYAAGAFSLREARGRPVPFCANGCDRDTLNAALNRVTGGSWQPPARAEASDDAAKRERDKARALALWNGSTPALGTPAAAYLAMRGLPELAASAALRFRLDCPHPDYKHARYPAMMALVVDVAGAPLALHRTFLRRDGSDKADIGTPRATKASFWGGAVRLDPLAPELVIGEGIESSASAGRILGLPAWAAISARNLATGLVLPPEVRSVVIAADHDLVDANGRCPGPDAAEAAARRWAAEGRIVRVILPDLPGSDFNDVLRARKAAHA